MQERLSSVWSDVEKTFSQINPADERKKGVKKILRRKQMEQNNTQTVSGTLVNLNVLKTFKEKHFATASLHGEKKMENETKYAVSNLA